MQADSAVRYQLKARLFLCSAYIHNFLRYSNSSLEFLQRIRQPACLYNKILLLHLKSCFMFHKQWGLKPPWVSEWAIDKICCNSIPIRQMEGKLILPLVLPWSLTTVWTALYPKCPIPCEVSSSDWWPHHGIIMRQKVIRFQFVWYCAMGPHCLLKLVTAVVSCDYFQHPRTCQKKAVNCAIS